MMKSKQLLYHLDIENFQNTKDEPKMKTVNSKTTIKTVQQLQYFTGAAGESVAAQSIIQSTID